MEGKERREREARRIVNLCDWHLCSVVRSNFGQSDLPIYPINFRSVARASLMENDEGWRRSGGINLGNFMDLAILYWKRGEACMHGAVDHKS